MFVYFTADWCLTCKVNERVVLDDAEVQDALAREGFAVFEADWTRRDESIRAELARFGRSGVPLYLLYPAGRRRTAAAPSRSSSARGASWRRCATPRATARG